MEVEQYGLLEKLELPELHASYLQETQGGQNKQGITEWRVCWQDIQMIYIKDLHYPLQDVSFFFLFAANSSSSRSVGGLPGGWD